MTQVASFAAWAAILAAIVAGISLSTIQPDPSPRAALAIASIPLPLPAEQPQLESHFREPTHPAANRAIIITIDDPELRVRVAHHFAVELHKLNPHFDRNWFFWLAMREPEP
jgi:hypothetical protein